MRAATQHLVDGHRLIRRALAELEESLEPLKLERLGAQLDSFEELLGQHRRQEEEVLFPEVLKAGGMKSGILGTIVQQHEIEEALLEEARTFLSVALEDPDGSSGPLVDAIRGVVAFFRGHLWQEECFIFPEADRVLGFVEQQELLRRMKTAEVNA